MPDKYIIQRRTASGLETVAELPALESGKIDLSWLPVVGAMGSAIIERGSNANGEYIRWADGTQVCIIHQSPRIGSSHGYYGVYMTFPASFSARPEVFGFNDFLEDVTTTPPSPAYLGVWGVVTSSITTSGCRISCYILNGSAMTTRPGCFLVIGRWK